MIHLNHPRALVAQCTWAEMCQLLGPRGVDIVITDPPYTEHVHANIRSCTTNGKLKVKAWEPGFDALQNFAHVPALLEVARRWVLCFSALESFGDYVQAAGGHWKQKGSYVRSGIWRKQQAAPQLSGDRPANSCEGIAVMHARPSERMHWNGRGKHAFWRTDVEWSKELGVWLPPDELSVEHGRERAEKRHPAQKPHSLMRELVSLFSDPEDWILDPYCGSGATGLAALELGRRVILCDSDPGETGRMPWSQYAAQQIEAKLKLAA